MLLATVIFKDYFQDSHVKELEKKAIFRNFGLIIPTRYLNNVILGDSNRPNRIVQIHVLRATYT